MKNILRIFKNINIKKICNFDLQKWNLLDSFFWHFWSLFHQQYQVSIPKECIDTQQYQKVSIVFRTTTIQEKTPGSNELAAGGPILLITYFHVALVVMISIMSFINSNLL